MSLLSRRDASNARFRARNRTPSIGRNCYDYMSGMWSQYSADEVHRILYAYFLKFQSWVRYSSIHVATRPSPKLTLLGSLSSHHFSRSAAPGALHAVRDPQQARNTVIRLCICALSHSGVLELGGIAPEDRLAHCGTNIPSLKCRVITYLSD